MSRIRRDEISLAFKLVRDWSNWAIICLVSNKRDSTSFFLPGGVLYPIRVVLQSLFAKVGFSWGVTSRTAGLVSSLICAIATLMVSSLIRPHYSKESWSLFWHQSHSRYYMLRFFGNRWRLRSSRWVYNQIAQCLPWWCSQASLFKRKLVSLFWHRRKIRYTFRISSNR